MAKKPAYRRPLFRDPPFTPDLLRRIAVRLDMPRCPHDCDKLEPKESRFWHNISITFFKAAEKEEKTRKRELRAILRARKLYRKR